MPEPKKTNPRPFESQADSTLDGVRLSRPARAETGERNQPAPAPHRPAVTGPDEPDLVSKLIDFIKSM